MAIRRVDIEHPSLKEATRQKRRAPTPRRSGHVRWSRDKFNQFIEEHGYRLLWQQSVPCPCQANTQTKQPHPFCPVCGGGGYEYFDPRIIRGLFTEVTGDYELFPGTGQQRGYAIVEKFGEWMAGEAVVSFRPEHPVGFRDRLTMLDAAIEFSEVVERKTGDVILPLRYRIVPRMVELFDMESNQEVVVTERVIRLRVWSSTNGSTRVLREGSDFDVLPDGTLDLSKGDFRETAPNVGDRVAIKYTINPPWVVYDLKPQYYRQARATEEPKAEDLLPYPRTLGVALDFLVKPEEE